MSTQLLGSPCVTFSKGTKVRSGPNPQPGRNSKGLYSYPDLLVVFGEMQFHDEHQDVLLNPTVIIEVLSPATEAFDRGEKFLRYRIWNPTLTDYVLVWQSSPIVEHFARQSDGSWSFRVYQGLEQSLTIQSINCTLQLADVYDRIVFPAEPADEIDDSQNGRN